MLPSQSALQDLCSSLKSTEAPGAVCRSAFLEKPIVDRFISKLGQGPVCWTLEQVVSILPQVRESFADIPDFPRREVGATLETLFLDMLAGLYRRDCHGVADQRIPATARKAAQRDVSIDRILHSMRMVQAAWTSRLLAAFSGHALGPADYQWIVTTVSSITDETVNRFVDSYVNERASLLGSRLTRRLTLVQALINRELPGPRMTAAETREELGIAIEHVHIGCVIVSRHDSGDFEDRVNRDLRTALPGANVLVLSPSRGRVWIWISTLQDTTSSAVERIIRASETFKGTVCTVGEPARGAEGFRRTHLQASDLAAIADGLGNTAVLRWSDRVLTALLVHNVERSRWFIRSVLGPLAERTPKAEEYRRTLQAYLSSGQSLLEAGERRHVHRNTVVYRLQQIEALLNRPIRESSLDLQCALHLVECFGESILEDSDRTLQLQIDRASQSTGDRC